MIEKRVKRMLSRMGYSKRYLVAVSGGRDSVALFHALTKELPPANLGVFHFNHKTRGRESQADEAFVRRLSDSHKIPFYLGSPTHKKKSEESLREDRYNALQKFRTLHGFDYVMLAHHAEDQLETFCLRLLRGTSLDGLSAMKEKNGCYLRPLLRVSRKAVNRYVKAEHLRYRDDRSNDTHDYFRNRVRHRLTPTLYSLSEEFGGSEKFLRRFSRLMREMEAHQKINAKRGEVLFRRLVRETPLWLFFKRESFLDLSRSDQNLLLKRMLLKLGRRVESAPELNALRRNLVHGKNLSSKGGLQLEISCGVAFISTERQRVTRENLSLERTGKRVRQAELDLELEISHKDAELRFFKEGDRLGRKKLKALFLRARIPAPERRVLPVLAQPGKLEVLWVFPEPSQLVRIVKNERLFSFQDSFTIR